MKILSGQSLVYFSPERWEGMWRNRQQLMSVFARENKVLFVEPRPYLRDLLTKADADSIDRPQRGQASLTKISENLHVYRYPPWAPISGRTPVKQLTAAARAWALRAAMRKLGLSAPIVWLSRPYMSDLLSEIPPPRMLIYHVVDEYSAYYGTGDAARRAILAAEKDLLARADLAIVVSQKLYESKRPLNPNTFIVRNGVNLALFDENRGPFRLPPALAAIEEPRLGYIGHIGDRLDLAALTRLATGHPEWSLVFVGEVRFSGSTAAWEEFAALPNVHYLGTVPAAEVADYVRGFQVGLMPYVRDRHSENVSPLKLYEYLAAGIPIVSSDIPAAREFVGYVHIVEDGSAYDTFVKEALQDTDAQRRAARISEARHATWEHRAQEISELIRARGGDLETVGTPA